MPFSSKQDYARAFELIRVEIHEWDPYSLMSSGSPIDEFDGEVRSIVRQIPRIKSKIDAAHVVSRTFSSSFDANDFPVEACITIGEKIHGVLVSAKLIDGPAT